VESSGHLPSIIIIFETELVSVGPRLLSVSIPESKPSRSAFGVSAEKILDDAIVATVVCGCGVVASVCVQIGSKQHEMRASGPSLRVAVAVGAERRGGSSAIFVISASIITSGTIPVV
jgi:hypothetical protein